MIGFALLFVVAFVGWLLLERSMDGSGAGWDGWGRSKAVAPEIAELRKSFGTSSKEQERQLAEIDAEARAIEAREEALAAERLPADSVALEPEPLELDLDGGDDLQIEVALEPAAPLRSEPEAKSGQPVVADDLKQIRGIGPKIEKCLKGLGIETFEAVADMTPEQIETIGATLGGFKSRMKRDRWVQQARKLARARPLS